MPNGKRVPPLEKTALLCKCQTSTAVSKRPKEKLTLYFYPLFSIYPFLFVFFMFHMEPGQVTIYSFGLALENHEINPGILGQNSTPAFLSNGRAC